MINILEVEETNRMVSDENLDVRTITIGISLFDCMDSDLDKLNEKIYKKITTVAKDLVACGEKIEKEFGIPIVHKRISVTPIAMIGAAACHSPKDYVTIAKTLDKAAKTVGVNFLGGYSAIVSKGMTTQDQMLIESIPEAMASTDFVCSSVNVGSTKTGINMDAVRLLGQIVKDTALATKENDSLGCAKLVIFCNAPDDNPFMAGAFHGVSEADAIINVGVSGPGVVKTALSHVRITESASRLSVSNRALSNSFFIKLTATVLPAYSLRANSFMSHVFPTCRAPIRISGFLFAFLSHSRSFLYTLRFTSTSVRRA